MKDIGIYNDEALMKKAREIIFTLKISMNNKGEVNDEMELLIKDKIEELLKDTTNKELRAKFEKL